MLITLKSIIKRNNVTSSLRRLNLAFLMILLTLTILLSLHLVLKGVVITPDSYLHLTVGKYIALHKEIPEHYNLSYKITEPSLEWISHGWLADLIIFILTAPNPEFQGMYVVLILITALMVSLFFTLRQLGISNLVSGVSLSIFIFISTAFWKLHPFLFIWLIYSLQLFILTTALQKNSYKRLLFLPFLAFFWAQLYGGYLFIFFITILAYLIYAGVQRIKRVIRSGSLIRYLTLAFAGSLFLSLLNPLGSRVFVYWVSFIGIATLKQGFSSLTGILTLVNQNIIKENISTIPYAGYLIFFVLVVSIVSIGFFSRRVKLNSVISPYLPLIILGLLPFIFIKLLPFGLMAILIVFAAIMQYFYQRRERIISMILCLALIISIPLLALLVVNPYKMLIFRAPLKQVEFIKQENLPNNIFTSPEFTGYVAFKTMNKMNIDLLDDVFDETETINLYLESGLINKERLQNIIRSNNAQTILVAKEGTNIAQSLNAQFRDDWALVYIDKNGLLFVNKTIVTADFLKKYELRSIDLNSPLGIKSGEIENGILELRQFVARNPLNTLAVGQLATLYRISKAPEKAEKLLFTIPHEYWDYAVLTELGRVQAALGRCELSEKYFLRALEDRSEQNYSRTILDIAVVYAGCLNDPIKARHFFERYLSFPLPQTEKDKARTIADDFGINLR